MVMESGAEFKIMTFAKFVGLKVLAMPIKSCLSAVVILATIFIFAHLMKVAKQYNPLMRFIN